MLPITNYETYQDGQIIFEEGSNGDWLYVIESGAVEISKKTLGGIIVIQILQPGDIFGELAYIANIPRTATAKSIGETTIAVVDRDFLDNEYNKLSQYFQLILKTITHRLQRTTEALANIKQIDQAN